MKEETGVSIPEGVVDAVRGGYAIVKAENDTLAMMALQRPRDPKAALKRACAELELAPEFAEKQYYRIPYKDRATGKTSWVEGLSVKAALALGRCWGNCTVTARLLEETDDAFIVQGVATDHETMFRVQSVGSISKWYKAKKTGRMIKHSEERFPQVLGAGASKAKRNALLDIIPEPIRLVYWNKARALASGGGKRKPINYEKTIPVVLKSFEKFKDAEGIPTITISILEQHLGHPLSEATREEFGDLKATLNAIDAGETTLYDAFGVGDVPDVEATIEPTTGSDDPLGTDEPAD